MLNLIQTVPLPYLIEIVNLRSRSKQAYDKHVVNVIKKFGGIIDQDIWGSGPSDSAARNPQDDGWGLGDDNKVDTDPFAWKFGVLRCYFSVLSTGRSDRHTIYYSCNHSIPM